MPGRPQDDGPPEIISRPRVLFEEHLVLARRAWKTAAPLLREAAGSGPGAQKLLRLDRWRRIHGLPGELFFTLRHDSPPATGSPGVRRPAAKPQYVSFRSTLLIDSMLDALQDHAGSVVFEEMLPAPGMLARRGDARHAVELVLQLDRES